MLGPVETGSGRALPGRRAAAREELNTAHARALADERAAADRRLEEARSTLLERLASALAERDALSDELTASREAMRDEAHA
jgi:hypothetical protein